MGKRKIVIDTSVVVCGLLSKGSSNKLLKTVLGDDLEVVISPEIFNEYIHVFYYEKLSLIRFKALIFLDRLYNDAVVAKPERYFQLCRDAGDDKFLDVVHASKAQYLITLDNDLIKLRDADMSFSLESHTFWIMKPAELLELMKK